MLRKSREIGLSVAPSPHSRLVSGASCPTTRPSRPMPAQRGHSVRFIGIFGALLSVALVLTVGALLTLLAAPFRAALALRRA
jgi:hypothetical protein